MAASTKSRSFLKRALAVWFAIIATLLGLVHISPISSEYKSKLFRAHRVFIIETVILMCGWYIWTHLFRVDDYPAASHHRTNSDCRHQANRAFLQNTDRCSPMSVRAIAPRVCMATFLLASHASYVTNLYFNRTNPHWFAMICYICYGLFIQLFSSLFFLDVIHWTAISRRFNQVQKHQRFVLACMYSIAMGSYGIYNATRLPSVKYVDVPIDNLPTSMDNFHIVQLTDIHLGPTVGQRRLMDIVDITNTLNADIIVMTGDLVDGSVTTLGKAASPLQFLKAKRGKYFVSGNHEYYTGVVDDWFSYLRRTGFTVLHNSHVKVKSTDDDMHFFYLAGTDDIIANKIGYQGHGMDIDKAVSTCESHHPIIFLAHQPKAAKQILNSKYTDVQLVLSGHTHGGQMIPFHLAAFFMNPFYAGLYRYRGRHVYVSQGTQYWGVPMRIGTRMEITHITLQASAR